MHHYKSLSLFAPSNNLDFIKGSWKQSQNIGQYSAIKLSMELLFIAGILNFSNRFALCNKNWFIFDVLTAMIDLQSTAVSKKLCEDRWGK